MHFLPSRHRVLLLTAVVFFCGSATASAQWQYLKNHPDVHQAFVATIAEARKSTVQIESNERQVALGAIIDPAGLIISKSSELAGDLRWLVC